MTYHIVKKYCMAIIRRGNIAKLDPAPAVSPQNLSLSVTAITAVFRRSHPHAALWWVSTRAGGTVGLPSICFGDISGQDVTINVHINRV